MKDFNDIIKDKIYDYQESPSPDIFDNIRKYYPKRTFLDKLKYNKAYLIVSVIVVVSIIGIIITIHNTTDPVRSLNSIENNIPNTIPLTNNNIESDNYILDNINSINEINTEDPVQPDNKTDREIAPVIKPLNTEILHVNIFDVNDTVICGNIYNNRFIENARNIIIPDNINLEINKDKISLISNKPGKYIIKYIEQIQNKILVDSMTIEFNQLSLPQVKFSSDILCYNEELVVTIDGNNYNEPQWNTGNAKVDKISGNKYQITGLDEGNHNLSLTFNIGQCKITEEQSVKVKEKIQYSYSIKPNYCAGINASVNVKSENYNPQFYILDNKQVNKTGYFEDLNSGLHILQINYDNNCNVYDTLFIFDSLNLNPYFKSEKDIVEGNKYYFRNYTKIDDSGYEKNKNIEFIWKINDTEFSRSDNPYYEFNQAGDYLIELVATLNNGCFGTYSENIIISNVDFKIPNIFTPNGDGIGDYFDVFYSEQLLNYNIVITSMSGEKVFESNDINKSWDGKIFGNNDASDGYYYYVIRGEDNHGNIIDHNGVVQLIRR